MEVKEAAAAAGFEIRWTKDDDARVIAGAILPLSYIPWPSRARKTLIQVRDVW